MPLYTPDTKPIFRSSLENNIETNKIINNCCKENLPCILNYLILNENADIKSNNEFLLLATERGHNDIV